MWPLKTILFFFSFSGACALSLAYPLIGVVNYMSIYLANPNRMWWGRPLIPLGIRYSLTAAVCMMLGMVISGAHLPRVRGWLGGWMLLLLIFTTLVLCSGQIGGSTSPYGMVMMDKMVKLTVFLICFVRIVSSPRGIRIVLWTLTFGTLLIGYDAFTASGDDFLHGRLNFVGASDFRESSGLAAHMSAMLPLVGVTMLTTRHWFWRILAGSTGLLAIDAIVQCRTRSAFIGLIAGTVVALLVAPRRLRSRMYFWLLIAVVGGYQLTDNFYWKRMDTTFNPIDRQNDATIQARLQLWGVAVEMFIDHPFGVGVGQFREELAKYNTGRRDKAFDLPRRVTHNSYLLCATELGIQGLIVFGLLIVTSLMHLRDCARLSAFTDRPREYLSLTYGFLVALVIYLTAAAFTDRLYTESFWWVLTLPICLQRTVEEAVYGPITAQANPEEHDTDVTQLPTGHPAPGAFA